MEFTTYSNQGSREYNEDSVGIAEHGGEMCFVLADGLGGHGGGEVASKTAVNSICGLFKKDGYSNTFFEEAFQKAQDAIFEEQYKVQTASKMKTTLVVLVITEDKAYYAHVGDSRLYLFNNNRIKTRTIDHSVPQMLAISGEIKEKEIRHHPDRNRLMRVMGVQGEKPRCEIAKPVKLKGNMSFLLCSDGYWELIEEAEMEKAKKVSKTLEEWIKRMNETVRKNGAGTDMDNYSAVAVSVTVKRGLFG